MHRVSTVTIIGGGAAGALAAIHLARSPVPTRIVLVERTTHWGRGVAYAAGSDRHLLNVPAARMSAFPDDPEHFLRWARGALRTPVPRDAFLPRPVYGRYLEESLQDACRHGFQPVERRAGAVVDLIDGETIRLVFADGSESESDRVVLALGNPLPGDPPVRCGRSLYASSRYVRNPWAPSALDEVSPHDDVLLVGTGLTMFDVALELCERGHRGTIHALSRRGLRPRAHSPHPLDVPAGPPPARWLACDPTARGLLREVRKAIAELGPTGDWRSVIDSLRPVTPELWQRMNARERQRFIRRVRPFWDVHRHRAAVEVHRDVERLESEARLQFRRGRLTGWQLEADGVTALLADGTLRVGHVVNCTGPDDDVDHAADPLVRALRERGLVVRDPHGLGVETGPGGSLIDAGGAASTRLFTLGTWRRPARWESTAIPELRNQAAALAALLARDSAETRDASEAAATTPAPRPRDPRSWNLLQSLARAVSDSVSDVRIEPGSAVTKAEELPPRSDFLRRPDNREPIPGPFFIRGRQPA